MNCTVFRVQLLEQVIYLFTLQSACNGELEEAWIVNKSINCFFRILGSGVEPKIAHDFENVALSKSSKPMRSLT